MIDAVVSAFVSRYPEEVEAMVSAIHKNLAQGRAARFTPAEQTASDHFDEVWRQLVLNQVNGMARYYG